MYFSGNLVRTSSGAKYEAVVFGNERFWACIMNLNPFINYMIYDIHSNKIVTIQQDTPWRVDCVGKS